MGDKRRGLRGGAVGGGVGIFRNNNTVPAAGAIFNGGIEAVVGGAAADDELLNVVFVQHLRQRGVIEGIAGGFGDIQRASRLLQLRKQGEAFAAGFEAAGFIMLNENNLGPPRAPDD